MFVKAGNGAMLRRHTNRHDSSLLSSTAIN